MTYDLFKYGEKYIIELYASSYADNGNLAIEMILCENDIPSEYWDTLTVNLDKREERCAYVDTNNNGKEIIAWILDNGIGELTGNYGSSGYCTYPEVKFNFDKLVFKDNEIQEKFSQGLISEEELALYYTNSFGENANIHFIIDFPKVTNDRLRSVVDRINISINEEVYKIRICKKCKTTGIEDNEIWKIDGNYYCADCRTYCEYCNKDIEGQLNEVIGDLDSACDTCVEQLELQVTGVSKMGRFIVEGSKVEFFGDVENTASELYSELERKNEEGEQNG